ncbi:MAG: hypothetical protein HY060_08010 [Proteobacteria bacterium]|nr:hypothetical protein [Pseudomonadota bacterium]
MKPEDQADAFLRNISLETAQAYANRGRRHEHVPTEQLVDAWVVAFKIWTSDYQNALLRGFYEELEAELVLRGIEPPYERVKEAADKLRDIARQLIDNLSPQEHARVSADIQRDVDAFTAAARAARKN